MCTMMKFLSFKSVSSTRLALGIYQGFELLKNLNLNGPFLFVLFVLAQHPSLN